MITQVSRNQMSEGAKKSAQIQKDRKEQRILQYTKCCEQCGKPIPYEKRRNKFCGHSCAASKNNLGGCRNPTGIPNRSFVKKECLHCGSITRNPKFCDSQCHRRFDWEQKKKEIEKTHGVGISVYSLKHYLLETCGHQCELCKKKRWKKDKIPLVFDHIDGNYRNGNLDNLRLICPNCDAQTPTFAGKNRGNGRHWRRQRYKDGKSY